MHPLVRDTSRPAPGPDPLAFAELAARLLKAAAEAAGETGAPEDPPTWSAWQLLAPHSAVVLNSLSALPDNSDETIGAPNKHGTRIGAGDVAAFRAGLTDLYAVDHRSGAIPAKARARQLEQRITGALNGGVHTSGVGRDLQTMPTVSRTVLARGRRCTW